MSLFGKLSNLIKKILSIPRFTNASFRFVEAWDLVARERYEDAEKMFELGEGYLNTLPFEYKIMKGHIKHRLGKRDECLELFKNAWENLDKKDDVSIDDKQYLKGWMYRTLIIYQKFFGTDLSEFERIDICKVPLDKVSRTWKRQFPYRDHSDWDKYGV